MDIYVPVPHSRWEDVITYLEQSQEGRKMKRLQGLQKTYPVRTGIKGVAHVQTRRGYVDRGIDANTRSHRVSRASRLGIDARESASPIRTTAT